MSNRRNAILMGGALVLLVTAGTASAFTGADDPTTASGTSATSSSTTSTTVPGQSTISVRPSTSAPSSASTDGPAPAAGVTAQEAEGIALGLVGGRVVRTEGESEHGGWEWHVRVDVSGVRHDVRVDAASGAVRGSDVGDDGGHGGDDNSGRGGDDGNRGRGGDDH
ncbi:PepSY domain-containing protein [Umezawaea sp. Da 62-37]|uniref:PepSY domain-containing protein n=1 Tax=Umezawaea sp. Da 62-37 TaxID=3075927 RepID=UPI0028F6E443|nr:PepSY domain-containing protein [Umezawaea sp. Da 62-37]WNV88424.1 PepSY domain-containing protein [Umezawaea sp. Da 62-37]